MAKLEKPSKQLILQPSIRIKPWAVNKVTKVRKLSEHRAAKAVRRWGAPAGVALIVLILISPFFLPQNSFQQAKNRLLRNPDDFHAQIIMAEKFMANNQFEEAEKALLLAESQIGLNNQVLGEQANSPLEELWQKKFYSDPHEIKKIITVWEEIIKEEPNYRDGYLRLTYLYYKLYENEKAKEHLEKAVKLDPNYTVTKNLEKLFKDQLDQYSAN